MRVAQSLRSRLVIGIGLLAGAAVVAASTAAFAVVQSQLRGQIDDSLLSQPISQIPMSAICHPVPNPFGGTSRLQFRLQRVSADGSTCSPDSGSGIPVTASDLAVARTGTGGGLHDADAGGVHFRVRVLPAGAGYAVQMARPLTETDDALARLATILVSGTLVTLLAVTSLAVLLARRLLASVDTLTLAAEHIARTEDLNVPIALKGRDEVARLATAFNRMTSRLAQSRQRQQQLVADASHELRTPLTSLRTNAELLARSQDSGRPLDATVTRRLYASITAQAQELAGLIEELTLLARDQPPDLAAEPVQLDDIVARAVERARLRAGDVPVNVARLQRCEVHGDAVALERAVVNLLDNAIKFSPSGAPVSLALIVEGNHAVVDVVDDGRGIAEEDMPHVFDRFWRAADSRDLPGSGLGLAIVHQTARAHGGSIHLSRRSASGGTAAQLRLPVV